ncbi:MAG: NTP transferase domain-containing protein [Anaerolineae bacterium]|nr:NTP transferase domain-containing protein [Anaerolineae bacterium]
MKLIIPLAGFGSRMRPHTWTKPKPLINVAGKPFIGHLLDKFAPLDIEELIIIYGWLGDQIQAYVKDNYAHLHPRFVEQAELKGQSHALWLARDYLTGDGIIIFVDTFFDMDVGVLSNPKADLPGVDGISFVKEVDDPRRFGVVELDGEGFVTRFIEKPTEVDNKKVGIGFYWVRDLAWMVRCIEDHMASGNMFKGEFFLTHTFQVMVDRGARFRTHEVDVWQDTGKPETTLQCNRYLLEHGCDNSAQVQARDSVIVPPVHIAADAVIKNAVVGPYVNICSGATVQNAIVCNSLIDIQAVVKDIFLEGSLIGEKAQVIGQPTRLNIGNAATTGTKYEVDESFSY